jgi:bifunctional polynucleotide phosphatase/kinase
MPPIIKKIGSFRARKKIAAFDYDWTLVKPSSGGTFPKNVDDWMWLNATVVENLKKFYEKGFAIVIFTNQTKKWKCEQIEKALSTLNIPVLIAIGMEKEDQKPNKILFETAVTWKWDTAKSFFVGDALGRPGDWSNSDRVFAERVGFINKHIQPPEDIFIVKKSKTKSIPKVHVAVAVADRQEIVIMIGYPGSGKSTIVHDIFEKSGYAVFSGDELKTSVKMIKRANELLEKDKTRSLVFDATNPSKKKRAEYIQFAQKWKIPVRCIHVATPMEESMARNQKRPPEKIIPRIAYNLYKKNFEEPSESEECTVITI